MDARQRVHMRTASKTTLLKVVILGDGGVGKSCLMNRFVSNFFDDHSFHTIGVEFLKKDLEVDGVTFTLQIWDTAGQERFKSLRTPFYRGTDVCMLTYAIDDRSSFDNLKMWMDEFRLYADIPESNENFPFLVVGSKSDKTPREVSVEQLADWCTQHRISSYIEASSKTANNVTEAFILSVKRWIALERMAEIDMRALTNADSVNLGNVRRENGGMQCCLGSCGKDSN